MDQLENNGICSHGLPSGGRDLSNGKSTFSVGEKVANNPFLVVVEDHLFRKSDYYSFCFFFFLKKKTQAVVASSCALIAACPTLSEVS